MANTMQENRLFQIGCLFLTFCIGLVLFLIAVTIVLSLIPAYLLTAGSNINGNNGLASTSFQATYATNLENASQLMITDTSSLSNSLRSQLHFSKSSVVTVILSKFLPLSSATLNKRKKRESTCDYDTNGMTGDRYITQIQVTDPRICHTSFCLEKFSDKTTSDVKRYSSLTLPFTLSNSSVITISMILCKFGALFSISPTCTDSIQNQDETDVDCGGLQCARRCSINETCSVTSNCNNATCVMGTCLGESATILAVCQIIKEKISSASQLFYSYDSGYNETIMHYALSSIMPSVCSVEPGTVADVSTILKIIGQYRVPFAVEGGGHSLNPGFSSTTGVHIRMTRFHNVIYHAGNQTVDVGSGLIWDDVYQALEPYNVTVIGGRDSSVGVAGLVLGGGYSWKTNQYGLSIDNVFEYELVAPNGSIVYVNSNSYPDIFFGLKGGFNNFGIVTNFNMRAVPQTQVYGGVLIYSPLQFNAGIQAIVNFQANNTDPKAQISVSFAIAPGQFVLLLIVCYDAPTPPHGMFDELLAISPFGTLQTLSYLSLARAAPSSAAGGLRGRYTTISMTNVTTQLLNGIINQLVYFNSTLGSKIGAFLAYSFETFLSSYLNKSQGGAYPHIASSTPLIPLLIQFSCVLPSDDEIFLNQIKLARDALFQMVLDQGQDVGGLKEILYPNYALDNTPLSEMYGDNVVRLQNIRQAWDPENVMYLTGGFKF